MGTGLGKFLPVRYRSVAGRLANWWRRDYMVLLDRPKRQFSGSLVLVAGLFGTTTGLGRAAELVALTLESRGHNVVRWDFTAAIGETPTRPFNNPNKLPDCSDVVIVCNPNVRADMTFQKDWLYQRCVIGHWIYEVENVPKDWGRLARLYDQVWAPTSYVREALQTVVSGDVSVVPYGVEFDPMPLAIRNSTPGFVAGYSFAMNSCYYRKNPEAVVEAFKQAFPDDTDVRLLLRSNDMAEWPVETAALLLKIDGDPRIHVHNESNRISLSDFYNSIDVYVSSSKAEGYGLNLIESIQAGIPVISNGWRLPDEIRAMPGITTVGYKLEKLRDPQGCYADLGPSQWAAPNISEMATKLNRLKETVRSATRMKV